MIKKPEIDVTAKDYYTTSFYFFNASIRCWKIETNTNGVAKTLFVAAMANGALSCELLIKAIYCKANNKYLNGHNLYNLINKLPQDTISIIYSELEIAHYYNVKDLLKEYGNSFVEWRYFHEYDNSGNFYKEFLLDLYRVLKVIYDNLMMPD